MTNLYSNDQDKSCEKEDDLEVNDHELNTFEDQYDDKIKICGKEEELEVCNDKAV